VKRSGLRPAIATPVMAGAATDKHASETISLGEGSKAQADLKFAEIKRKKLSDLISATAVIEPDAHKIAHVTSRIRARVLKLIAEPGQEVKPGDPLAVLSSIELGQAKADYLKSRVLEQIAAQHLEREERLFKDKIASAKDVLEARANHEVALAQYNSTREALRLLISPKELAGLTWSQNGQPLSDFTLIFAMTQGGPGNQTAILPVYMYIEAFQFNQLGYGTTIALTLVLIGAILSIAYIRQLRPELQDSTS